MAEFGLYVLVKWTAEDKPTLDTYSIKLIADKKLASQIATAKDLSKYIGKETDVLFENKPYPAKLMAFGTPAEVERKRKKIESQIRGSIKKSRDPVTNQQNESLMIEIENQEKESTSFCEVPSMTNEKLLKKIQKLKRKNAQLVEENEKLPKITELDDLVHELKKVIKKLKNSPNTSREERVEEEEQMVDIGNNVFIKRSDLTSAEFSASGNPRVFARNILMAVFSEHELINSSISGKRSNAYPDIAAKNKLNPVKINAILTYVTSKFSNCAKCLIQRTLQDKIKEINAGQKKKKGNVREDIAPNEKVLEKNDQIENVTDENVEENDNEIDEINKIISTP